MRILDSSLLLFEDEASEQQDVHEDHEAHHDAQRQIRLGGSHGGQQQNGEAEDHGGEVLINQIVRNRGFEVAVDLTKQDHAGGGGTGELIKHHFYPFQYHHRLL